MKTFIQFALLLGLLFLTYRAHAINLLTGQGCATGNGGVGATAACTVANTGGLGQIVAVKWCNTSNACTSSTVSDVITVADSQGNIYTLDQRIDSSSGTDRRGMAVYHASNIGANASNLVTFTVTSGNTVNLAGLIVSAVGGVTSTMTADQVGTLDAVAATSPITLTTSGASTEANELVYSWINLNAGTLTIGPGYATNRQVDVNEKDEFTTVSTTGIKSATMTYSGSEQQRGIIVTYKTPALGVGTYYLSPTGLDTNNGTSSGTPWLTPNHPMTCGSVIIAAASTSYSTTYLGQGNWGAVDCPGTPNVVWLKCVTFDACKGVSSGGNPGLYVDSNYWGVQGFEWTISANTYAGCFFFVPNSGTGVSIHHGIFANNICNGGYAGGIATGITGALGSTDYVALIGNIAYAADAGTYCYSNINVYQPGNYDTQLGTHIYIAGNFSFGGQNTVNCNSGFPATDGEGINIDTLDNSQGGPAPYTQQVVVDNNVVLDNGGRGIEVEYNNICSPCAHVYVRHNTLWGNSTDNTQTGNPCAELQLTSDVNVEAYYNLSVPTANTSCNGQTVYAYQVSTSPTTTDHIYNDWGYSSFGNNSNIVSSTGFSFGPNNTFGTSPAFANATNPSAPSCGSFASVPACMATLIANFTPTNAAAASYGYQAPVSTQTYDPLFPQWLCSVTNLPSGLVTMGCLTGSSTSNASLSNASLH